MKKSKFNVLFEHGDNTVIFNPKTCGMAMLNNDGKELLNNINEELVDSNPVLVGQMLDAGFLVEDNIDEIKQLELHFEKGKHFSHGLALTIAPTLLCNFSCLYCYEDPKKDVMNEQTQNKLIALVEEFAENKQDVEVTWFGGEPLLAFDVIDYLSAHFIETCSTHEVQYKASIVTNGYLLNDKIKQKMKDNCISEIQITLDGLPETHNRRRCMKDKKVPTFDRIVDNAKSLLDDGLEVDIRFNIDKNNYSEMDELLDLVEDRGLSEGTFYLGHLLGNTEKCKEIDIDCFTYEEFAKVSSSLQGSFLRRNMSTQYPEPFTTYCGANYLFAYVVEPDGTMYKCWNEIGMKDKSIANINDFGSVDSLISDANENYCNYMTWSPFKDPKCRDCEVLPICMGGCQYNGVLNNEHMCERWKFNLIDYLKIKCGITQNN